MDAGFFARLRVMDDMMFLAAAGASAARGHLDEVASALSTLRSDLYEPLLWGPREKVSITLPRHPFGDQAASGMGRIFLPNDLWAAVGVALTSPQLSWDQPFASAFVQTPGESSNLAFDAERREANGKLLDQAIQICRDQAARPHHGQVPTGLTITCDDPGISAWYGPTPWAAMLRALSKAGCQWTDLAKVVEAIPVEVIEHNQRAYQDAARELVCDGNVPIALRLVARNPALKAGLLEITAYGGHTRGVEHSIVNNLPSCIASRASLSHRDQCADAALGLMEICFAGARDPVVGYLDALQRMLPSLAEPGIVVGVSNSDPELNGPQRKMIERLMAKIDEGFGATPDAAWPSVGEQHLGGYGQGHAMTLLLDAAIRARYAPIVHKLRDHWGAKNDQVNLVGVAERLPVKTPIEDELRRSIISILATAQSAGLDLNQPLLGDDPSSPHHRTKAKPAFILHAVAKATTGIEGQLDLLKDMVLLGIDPSTKDRRGWKAEVFIGVEDRDEWREIARCFSLRQRASSVMNEILSGDVVVRSPRARGGRAATLAGGPA